MVWNLHATRAMGVDAGEWGDILMDSEFTDKGYRGRQELMYQPYAVSRVPDQAGGTSYRNTHRRQFGQKIRKPKEQVAPDSGMLAGNYSDSYSPRMIPKNRNSSIRPDDPVNRFSGYFRPSYTHFTE